MNSDWLVLLLPVALLALLLVGRRSRPLRSQLPEISDIEDAEGPFVDETSDDEIGDSPPGGFLGGATWAQRTIVNIFKAFHGIFAAIALGSLVVFLIQDAIHDSAARLILLSTAGVVAILGIVAVRRRAARRRAGAEPGILADQRAIHPK